MAQLTLNELLKSREKLAAKDRAGEPQRMSVEEFRKMYATDIKKTEDLTKSNEELTDQLKEVNKTSGDGLNSNIKKLYEETKKVSKGLTGLSKEDAKDVTGKALGRPEFKTIGERVRGRVDSIKDFFTLRGFLDKSGLVKRGTGGIFDTMLAKRDARAEAISARMQIDPQMVNLKQFGGSERKLKAYLGKQFDKAQGVAAEMRVNEAQIEKLKAAGYTEDQMGKTGLIKKRAALAEEIGKYDKTLRVKEESTEKVSKKSKSKKVAEEIAAEERTEASNIVRSSATKTPFKPEKGTEVDFSGQKYRFLGQQWAEVNAEGKTSKMAEKGIVAQLNKLANTNDVSEEESEGIAREEKVIALLGKIEENTRTDVDNIERERAKDAKKASKQESGGIDPGIAAAGGSAAPGLLGKVATAGRAGLALVGGGSAAMGGAVIGGALLAGYAGKKFREHVEEKEAANLAADKKEISENPLSVEELRKMPDAGDAWKPADVRARSRLENLTELRIKEGQPFTEEQAQLVKQKLDIVVPKELVGATKTPAASVTPSPVTPASKVETTKPTEAAAVYESSSSNAAASMQPVQTSSVVVAPQTSNVVNNNTSVVHRIPPRSNDITLQDYFKSRYA